MSLQHWHFCTALSPSDHDRASPTDPMASWRSFRSSTGVFSLQQIAELYTGASATWGRATMMLTTFFILCDQAERAAPELMSRPLLGGFLKGGVCATVAWGVAWVRVQMMAHTLHKERTQSIR